MDRSVVSVLLAVIVLEGCAPPDTRSDAASDAAQSDAAATQSDAASLDVAQGDASSPTMDAAQPDDASAPLDASAANDSSVDGGAALSCGSQFAPTPIPLVAEQRMSGSPTFSGGSVPDGTYEMNAIENYFGTPSTLRFGATLTVRGGRFEWLRIDNAPMTMGPFRALGTLSADTQLTVRLECSVARQLAFNHSYASDTLRVGVFGTTPTNQRVEIYSRR